MHILIVNKCGMKIWEIVFKHKVSSHLRLKGENIFAKSLAKFSRMNSSANFQKSVPTRMGTTIACSGVAAE